MPRSSPAATCSAARRTAQAAEIVVVNHHLLLADLALKDEGFGDLLPGAEAVILDEAHQVPDIAARSSSARVGRCGKCRYSCATWLPNLRRLPCERPRSPANSPSWRRVSTICEATYRVVPAAYEWTNLPDSFLDLLPEIETALGGLAESWRAWARAPVLPIARAEPRHWLPVLGN